MKIEIRQLAINSTVTPIGFIARAKDKCLSIIWICVLIVFSILSIVQTWELMRKLNLREKYASITITSLPLAPFPSVTICSINAYRRSALEALADFKAFFLLLEMQSNANGNKSLRYNDTTRISREKRSSGSCPDNFTNVADDFPNICYTDMFNQNYSFDSALQACKALAPNSTLPTFRTKLEYSSYQILMQRKYMTYCTNDVWVGLLFNLSDSVFRWVNDGSNMTFNYWDSTLAQPNLTVTAGVTHRVVGGSWQTCPLSSFRWFVCQLPLLYPAQTPKAVQTFGNSSLCPNSSWTYDNISNICYSVRYTQMNWSTATTVCQSFGRNVSLPYFCTPSELDSYNKFMNETPLFCNKRFWLGYSGCNDASYIMANGQTALTFLPFPPTAVQNFSQCVIFDYTATKTNETFGPYECSAKVAFFCQFRPNGSLCTNGPSALQTCSSSSSSTSLSPNASVVSVASLNGVNCPSNFPLSANIYPICYSNPIGVGIDAINAKSNCTSNNGTLPTFHTEYEFNSFRLLISRNNNLMTLPQCSLTTTTKPIPTQASSMKGTTGENTYSTSSTASYMSHSANVQQLSTTTSTSANTIVDALMFNIDYKLEDDSVSQMTKMAEALAYIVGQMSPEERTKLGYSIDQMMLHCTFNNVNCYNRDFVTWNEPSIGNCFTFNHRNQADRLQTNAGSDYGLDLLFNTSSTDYVNSTLSVGLKLFLEHKSNAIFYDTEAISIPFGYVLDVPLKYKYVKRLSNPYGECVSSKDEANYFFAGSYTTEGCLKTCQQKSVLHDCGCFDPNLPAPSEVNTRYCNITKLKCASSTLNQFDNRADGKTCTCHQACEDQIYAKTPTLSKRRQGVGLDFSQIAGIKVYYTKLSYIKMEEAPAYDVVSFFTDFSNIVGINIGAAFHTIFEIFMIIFGCLFNYFA